jgi:hypothetical protein
MLAAMPRERDRWPYLLPSTNRLKLVLLVLREARPGSNLYSPEGYARLAAKVLSGSLVLPR